MPIFLDTRGRTTLGVGVCGRCGVKMSLDDLYDDPNSPGLKVCLQDRDQLDPLRLPARQSDNLTLPFCRPDVTLTTEGPSPIWYCNKINFIQNVGFAQPWQPLTHYSAGDSITPQNVNDPDVDLPQNWFLCIVAGRSGATAPTWPTKAGVVLGNMVGLASDDLIQLLTDDDAFLIDDTIGGDGTVVWLCLGLFPN